MVLHLRPTVCTAHHIVQHTTLYSTPHCAAHHIVQHITLCSTLHCAAHHIVQHITLYSTSHCAAHHIVQHITSKHDLETSSLLKSKITSSALSSKKPRKTTTMLPIQPNLSRNSLLQEIFRFHSHSQRIRSRACLYRPRLSVEFSNKSFIA